MKKLLDEEDLRKQLEKTRKKKLKGGIYSQKSQKRLSGFGRPNHSGPRNGHVAADRQRPKRLDGATCPGGVYGGAHAAWTAPGLPCRPPANHGAPRGLAGSTAGCTQRDWRPVPLATARPTALRHTSLPAVLLVPVHAQVGREPAHSKISPKARKVQNSHFSLFSHDESIFWHPLDVQRTRYTKNRCFLTVDHTVKTHGVPGYHSSNGNTRR